MIEAKSQQLEQGACRLDLMDHARRRVQLSCRAPAAGLMQRRQADAAVPAPQWPMLRGTRFSSAGVGATLRAAQRRARTAVAAAGCVGRPAVRMRF